MTNGKIARHKAITSNPLACQGVVANEVDTVADTVERPTWLQAFRHHTGHSLHGRLWCRYLHNPYYQFIPHIV